MCVFGRGGGGCHLEAARGGLAALPHDKQIGPSLPRLWVSDIAGCLSSTATGDKSDMAPILALLWLT